MKLYSHDEMRYKTLKTFMDGGLQRRLRQDSRIAAALRRWGGPKLLRARRNWAELATAYGTEPNVRLVDLGPINGTAGAGITFGKSPGSDLHGEDPIGRPNDRIDLNLNLALRYELITRIQRAIPTFSPDEFRAAGLSPALSFEKHVEHLEVLLLETLTHELVHWARDHLAVELMKIVVEEPYHEDIDEVGFAFEQDAFGGICKSTCQAPGLAREELLLLEMMARRAAMRTAVDPGRKVGQYSGTR